MSFTPISSVFFSRLHSIFVNINVQITTVRLDSSSELSKLASQYFSQCRAALYLYRIADGVFTFYSDMYNVNRLQCLSKTNATNLHTDWNLDSRQDTDLP